MSREQKLKQVLRIHLIEMRIRILDPHWHLLAVIDILPKLWKKLKKNLEVVFNPKAMEKAKKQTFSRFSMLKL